MPCRAGRASRAASARASWTRPNWPRRATGFVTSLSLGKQPIHPMYGLTEEDVRSWLGGQAALARHDGRVADRAARPSDRCPALGGEDAAPPGGPGAHRRTWPHARIVRIVRDRGTPLSRSTKRAFGTPSLLTNLSLLARMDEAAAGFYRPHRRLSRCATRTSSAEPEQELRRICDFVGEAYEPAMLEDRSGATGVAAAHEWWKGGATGPLDRSRVGALARRDGAEVQRYAALNMGDLLEEYGYGTGVPAARRLAIVRPATPSNARYDEVLLCLSAPASAVRRPVPSTIEQLHLQEPLVFFGVVGQLDPDRARTLRPTLALAIVRLALLLLTRRLQGRPVVWVRRLTLMRRHPRDGRERAIARLLQVLAVSRDAEDLPAWSAPMGCAATYRGTRPAHEGYAGPSPAPRSLVVGVARSGTTLLRPCSAHGAARLRSRVALLRRDSAYCVVRTPAPPGAQSWPGPAVDFIASFEQPGAPCDRASSSGSRGSRCMTTSADGSVRGVHARIAHRPARPPCRQGALNRERRPHLLMTEHPLAPLAGGTHGAHRARPATWPSRWRACPSPRSRCVGNARSRRPGTTGPRVSASRRPRRP